MSSGLQQERYWREQKIRDREKAIMERWDQLHVILRRSSTMISLVREIEIQSVTIMDLQQQKATLDPSNHLLDVHEKMKKFRRQECQV